MGSAALRAMTAPVSYVASSTEPIRTSSTGTGSRPKRALARKFRVGVMRRPSGGTPHAFRASMRIALPRRRSSRVAEETGIAEAIVLARMTGFRLVAAAKVRRLDEIALYQDVIVPAVEEGIVDWRGEVEGHERVRLMARALATLMLGASTSASP